MSKAGRPALNASLAAGSIAIILNTLALNVADLVPLATAKGGLLRLIAPLLTPVLQLSGVAGVWVCLGAPPVTSWAFQTGFHLVVGVAMAVAYAFAIEPRLPGRPFVKGTIYALAVWLLNAFILLPATGERVAGSARLTASGMIWFAAAHTLFFITLAMLYAAFRRRSQDAI